MAASIEGTLAPQDAGAVPQFQHSTPAFRTFCGDRSLDALPKELDRAGATRAVIVYGPSLKDQHGAALGRVEQALGPRLAGRFEDVRQHSPVPSVEAAAAALAAAAADAVIAVGGGSAIVTARAATILLAEQQDLRALCTRRQGDGRLHSPRLLRQKLPQWVVATTPTTAYAKAGSAAHDPATGERLALFDPKTRAQGVFFDPVLALTAPPALTRASALNAFCMAVEGLQSGVDDPLATALLTHAAATLAQWLPRLSSEPESPGPRLRLMLAALLSGQGSDFAGGGLAQAISHAAGPRSQVANGVVEALLLPLAMRYNAPVTAARLGSVAQALGVTAPGEPSQAESAVAAVQDLLGRLGVPSRLRDVGITRAALPDIVEHTFNDWVITQVPRPIGPGELGTLLDAAW
ncbi:MAG TPA: iron-containing alcohol dehydrogenase family protein [Trebonia sp.]|jgi:alcohol dehydrogenase class IV|nr:iron-containing alcohol dehydrogenase family protein [Trebonia sp.]